MREIDQHLAALPRHAVYDDVDAVIALAGRQDVRFDQLGRGRMQSRYSLLTTPNMHVSEAAHSAGAIARGAVGKGLCAVAVPGDDGPQRHTGGACEATDAVLVRSGEEYLVSSRRSFRAVAVFLRQDLLEEAAEAIWGVSLRALAPGHRLGLDGPRARRRLHGLLRASLAPQTAQPGRPSLLRGTDAETEEAVTLALLRAARPPSERRTEAGRHAAARRAEAIVRETLAEDLSTVRLAMELGVPLRSLQQGFVDLFGTSIRAYRHALRLNAARRDLLRACATDSVSTVAFRWHLFHLGRFSVDYRRMFGEAPSATLRRGRGRGARRATPAAPADPG